MLLSSHALSEVAQTVDDVVIINHGVLVTAGPLSNLAKYTDTRIRVRSPETPKLRRLLAANGVSVEADGPDQLLATVASDVLGRLALEHNVVLTEMATESNTLEDVFLELTRDHNANERANVMTPLLRAETKKLLTLRATYAGLAALVVAAGGLTALISHTLAVDGGDLDMRREVLTIAGTSVAPAIALLFGLLVMGSEQRHNTITPTLLITPDRRRIFVAKAVVAAGVGLVAAMLANLVALASAAITLNAVGSAPVLDSGDIAKVTAVSIGVSILYGVVGLGVATLIRNPTTALIVILGGLYLLDPITSLLIPARLLPGGATEVIALSTVTPADASPLAAAAVLTAYAAAVVGACWWPGLQRDLT